MQQFDFKHLILLAGTNPLPNFVVADYFLRKNENLSTIWLIHSEENEYQAGTKDQADNFVEVLKKRWDQSPLEFRYVSLSDVSCDTNIYNDLEDKLMDEIRKDNGFHMNYTGGTKSMSTHIYLKLKETDIWNKGFSYLDARNFRLVVDGDGIIAGDLRKDVSMALRELIALHGFVRINKPRENIFTKAMPVFQRLTSLNALRDFYGSGGYKRMLFTDINGGLAENKRKIAPENTEQLERRSFNETLREISMRCPKEYRFINDNRHFNFDIDNKKFKRVIRFLDGEWLEYHVAAIMGSSFRNSDIKVEQNWEIKKPDWNTYFELDVILINGYQMTGISCSTSSRKALCKGKGFEIIHRTRQIGGDEAKAVLVTRLNDVTRDKVQQELEYHTGTNQGNILVLGEKDLGLDILKEKIKKFVLAD